MPDFEKQYKAMLAVLREENTEGGDSLGRYFAASSPD
jgi:hypothetical protein